jgi:replicative DNA helicase
MSERKDKQKKKPSYLIIPEVGKIPPQAIEIEEAIIGECMSDPGAFLRVSHYFKDESIFYTSAHQKIMNAIKELHEKKIGIDILTVMNQLKINNELEDVGGPTYLTELSSKVVSSANLEFHCMVITDKYLLRELIRIGTIIQSKAYEEESPAEIAQWAEEELVSKFDIDFEGKSTFKEALHATLLDIANKAKGLVSTFIKTGDSEVDRKLSLRERSICLVAGIEGCGKTKYVTEKTKGILDNNSNVRVLWFSMEDSKEQIVRSFISMDALLTTKEMQSINYVLSDDDVTKIHKAVENFGNYNIEFVDHVCSMATIMRKGRNIREKYKEDLLIIVIDNLGLIEVDSFYRGIERDDYIAGKIKEMCDLTDSFIFVLHHLTKETKTKLNINEGYRPRAEYIKGSTRILDYVQLCLLINLPRKYKDLVSEEKQKGELFNIKEATGKFDKTRFKTEFWSVNPHGDKNTKTITDLYTNTWDELKFVCQGETLEDGMPITVGFLLRKYIEYSISIDEINRHREDRFKSEKMSIYTFLQNKKWTEDYRPKQNSRTFYLYGNDISRSVHIQNLLIVESAKNRDGSDVDDENIIRYYADLDHNIFKPLTNEGWDELKSSKKTE